MLVALGLILLGACTPPGVGQAGSSSTPAASEPVTHDKMAQPVPTPGGFPTDVPVYPGARLTAGANFQSSGESTFGMEWETLDSIAKVHTFYATKLNQGDWTISFTGATATNFTAVFSRTSNSRETGIVGADGITGITKISLSLVLPA